MKKPNWTLEKLQRSFPTIAWGEPLVVKFDFLSFHSCRVCIANHGLTIDSEHLWVAFADAVEHIRKEHWT